MHRSPLGFWEKRYFASPAYKAIGNDEDNNTHNGALVSASNGLLWLNQEE